MATGTGSNSGSLNGDINVTPLIDVLLVLLIIFMVIVPVAPKGLGAQVPQPATKTDRSQETAVVVQILSGRSGEPTYRINQEDVTIRDLRNRLEAIFAVRASKVMFIQGDNSLDFSTVAEVVDIARGAGADHIGLITPKDRI